MSQLPFRWNLVQRQQLGSLLEGKAAEAYRGFVDDLRHCCTRLVASAGDSDLIFIGRSPESIFDYLSGILSDTPFADRCTLLNFSMRQQPVEVIERENPRGLIALHDLLASGGLEPAQIARSRRPITLVDLVCGGTTFGNLVGLLNHWAAAIGEDIKAVRRRLRFIGITIRSKNSPNTWRWYQQVQWAQQYPRSALRSIPISYWMWTYLGDEQKKVSRWYPPSEWGQEYVDTPPREEWNVQALRLAAKIHNRGTHRDERQRFASALARQREMRDPWLRQLVATLRRSETA